MRVSHAAVAWLTASMLVMVETSWSSVHDRRFSRQQVDPLQDVSMNWENTEAENVRTRSAHPGNNDINNNQDQHGPSMVTLKTNTDKINALRFHLMGLISEEAKQLSSNNQSIVSIAFLAFGVILFDVLTDAIFGDQSNLVASLVGGKQPRETVLPGFGLFGDNLNNLAEVVLNMLTIYLYRDESPDCGQRLLCESNQQAVSRGFLDTLVTYVSGFSVSFFLRQAPVSDNLEAMRAGRKGLDCIEMYPKCSISL